LQNLNTYNSPAKQKVVKWSCNCHLFSGNSLATGPFFGGHEVYIIRLQCCHVAVTSRIGLNQHTSRGLPWGRFRQVQQSGNEGVTGGGNDWDKKAKES